MSVYDSSSYLVAAPSIHSTQDIVINYRIRALFFLGNNIICHVISFVTWHHVSRDIMCHVISCVTWHHAVFHALHYCNNSTGCHSWISTLFITVKFTASGAFHFLIKLASVIIRAIVCETKPFTRNHMIIWQTGRTMTSH